MRTKTRLTITLDQDILDQVDGLVDNTTVRNRSHAIETLIKQSLQPKTTTAAILAGGKNSNLPSLKKINGRHLLSIMLDHLRHHHVNNIVICTNNEGKAIQDVFGNGADLGITIKYSFEEKPLGTAGALKNAQHLLGSNPFLVIADDVLTDLDLHDFTNFYNQEKTLATIGVKPRMGEKQYGQVFLQGNKIVKFLEHGTTEGISIISTGVYLLDPKTLNKIPANKPAQLETDIFPKLAKEGELSAFIFQGIWYDISTDQNYKEATERWQ